jgi:hypothetical protein
MFCMKTYIVRIFSVLIVGVLLAGCGLGIPLDISRKAGFRQHVGKVVRLPWDHWIAFNPRASDYFGIYKISLTDKVDDSSMGQGRFNEILLPKGHEIRILGFKSISTTGPVLVVMICDTVTPNGKRFEFTVDYMNGGRIDRLPQAVGLFP